LLHARRIRLGGSLSGYRGGRQSHQVLIDGEAIVCGPDGRANFDALRSRRRDDDAVLFAFDLLELKGEDWRSRQLAELKKRLASLLARASGAIQLTEHLDDDGELVFAHACRMGLEGIVSKRIDAPYRSGPCKTWLKSKEPGERGRAAGA
jgi:bifunctional non-homologous end joining protein LigD